MFTVLSNPSGASGSYTVSNSLNITNVNGADFWDNDFMISLVYINRTFNFTATPLLFEAIVKGMGGSAFSASGSDGWPQSGLVYMNKINDNSTSNGEAATIVSQSNGNQFKWQSGTSYIAPSSETTTGSIGYPTVLAMLLNSSYVTGFFGPTLNDLTWKSSAEVPTGYDADGYVGLYAVAHTSSGTLWATYELLLARPWPPNGIMPTVKVVGGYPVGQYLAWSS